MSLDNGQDTLSVAIVDDDETFRLRLRRAFVDRGWEAHAAGSWDEAMGVAREHSPALMLVDLRMPDGDGLELVEALRELDDSAAIVVLTGYGSIATALEAVKRGADHYLSKPIDADQIIAAYEQLRPGQGSGAAPPTTVPTLARVEWEHIQRVLKDCDGNITHAARLLGVHRRSLQRKLERYAPVR